MKGQPGLQVLINQFGSQRRMKKALGVEDWMRSRSASGSCQHEVTGRLLEKLKMLPMLAEMGKFFPKIVATGPCKEVIRTRPIYQPAGLSHPPVLAERWRAIHYPAVRHYPGSQDREAQRGMYRIQIYDATRRECTGSGRKWRPNITVIYAWAPRKWHAAVLGCAREIVSASPCGVDIMARSGGGPSPNGKWPSGKMEVAVAIGTEPALTFSAIVPAPPDIEEFIIAGFLRQKPVELVKCETVDLEVPAQRKSSWKATSKLDELRTEGPFGDHTGFYSLEDEYPVFHVTCITHRKNPIYATTIVGKPPMEDAWMGKAVERIFLPLMRLTCRRSWTSTCPWKACFTT